MGIQSKLLSIQTELKAPKNLRNSFGNYNYRNFESICEAVKPYLIKNNCTLSVEDDVVSAGDRVYIKATATLIDCETGEKFAVSALAREAAEKRGMDSAQVTGATSSYARKYAVNGLFLLDDTKDADTDEYKVEIEERAKRETKAPVKPISSEQELNNLINTVQGYVNKGVFTTENQKNTAMQYIKNKDVEGLKRTIGFCETHQKTA